MLLNLIGAMQKKETQCKEDIKKQSQSLCKATAQHLATDGGGIEQTLMMLANNDDKEEEPIVSVDQVQAFLKEERGHRIGQRKCSGRTYGQKFYGCLTGLVRKTP